MASSDDPYAPPRSSELVPPHEFRRDPMRGALWFAVPVFIVLLALVCFDYFRGRQFDALANSAGFISWVVPAALVGRLSLRLARSTTWPRYLALASLHGLAWGVFFAFVAMALFPPPQWELMVIAEGFALAMAVLTAVTLLLAATLRIYDRRRP